MKTENPKELEINEAVKHLNKELDKIKADKELEKGNKELLKQYYVELDDTKIDEFGKFVDKFISSDFILHLPGGVDISGKGGLKEYYISSKKAFKNGTHTIDDAIAERDKVAFRVTTTAWHQGEFVGIQPTAKKIKITFDGFWLVQEGKIVEWWSEYDALSMMQQLGMELRPKEAVH